MKTFLLRVATQALLLYLALNLLVALLVEPRLGRVSAYNGLFPGRARLPFGESPQQAYNFSLFDLDAMLASHVVSAAQREDAYRVFLIGDSATWGTLLRPAETLAGQLDALHLTAADGRPVRFYNLGYPTISLTKDLLVLDGALEYEPDLVIWLTTLEAFPRDKQLSVPLVENNPRRARVLVERAGLDLPTADLRDPGFWERTLVGRRKALADGIRLQMYGLMWAATGIDQFYPETYEPAQIDLEADPTFHGKSELSPDDLALEALPAARRMLGERPLLLVNEPILISAGENSDIRYNFYYPRLVYDQYRQVLREAAESAGLAYLDAWDLVPADEFTNSAIHIDRQGVARLAEALRAELAAMGVLAGQ